MVSNTLHTVAILLRDGGEWDWFINLSASDISPGDRRW
jgi:hypothetical protein